METQNQSHIGKGERWLSLMGGGALLFYALKRPVRASPARTIIPLLVGGGLLYRGATGHSLLDESVRGRLPAPLSRNGISVRKAVTVAQPPAAAYRFWRNLENLPRFMTHLESVQRLGDGRSHWVVKAPVGIGGSAPRLEWDAQITADRPDELIAWQTLPGVSITHSGQVSFIPVPHGRGTAVTVTLTYDPPGGAAGEAFAQLLNVVTAQQIKEEIRRFKAVLEAGETPTVVGQPSGRKAP